MMEVLTCQMGFVIVMSFFTGKGAANDIDTNVRTRRFQGAGDNAGERRRGARCANGRGRCSDAAARRGAE
jgi:hypothetical protein